MTQPSSGATGGHALRALLVSDLVDSTKLVEELGDSRAARLLAQHDEGARGLLQAHDGQEIDKTDGFLLLFERPLNAVWYSLEYHRLLKRLSEETGTKLLARVGIHLGEVVLRHNKPEDVARGAKPVEVEGLAKPTAARLMSLALPGQTLMTRVAYDVAQRSSVGATIVDKPLTWVDHGSYQFKGVSDPVEVFEVGLEGHSPLSPPADSEKAARVAVDAAAEAVAAAKSVSEVEERMQQREAAQLSGRGRQTVMIGVIALVAAIVGAAGFYMLTGGGESQPLETAPADPQPAEVIPAPEPREEMTPEEPPAEPSAETTPEEPSAEPSAGPDATEADTATPGEEPAPEEENVEKALPEESPVGPALVDDWAAALAVILTEHQACADGEDADACRRSTARALNAAYGLDVRDAVDAPFPVNDALATSITAGNEWEFLGPVTLDGVLEAAGEAVAQGRPVVAMGPLDDDDIALILPGDAAQSSSWGRAVPSSAVLFDWNPGRAFVGRPLSFVFSDPTGVRVFVYSADR